MVSGLSTLENAGQLSGRELALLRQRSRLHRKYEPAVELYADSDLPLCEIAAKCGFSAGALGSYLRRYQRELVLCRHGILAEGRNPQSVKIISAGEGSETAHAKYKDAVNACDSMEYIEYNVSQIARKFGLNGTALANYMRIHYEDIPVRREKIRRKLGINDNVYRGARPECVEQYAEAVEMYRSTDMTIPQTAETCRVSTSGFSQHLRFYHKEILRQKRQVRRQAQSAEKRVRGGLSGNGRKNNPSSATEEKYAVALALYRDTNLLMKTIAEQTGVPLEGFRSYLHKWHRELVLERSGLKGETDECVDLRKARKRMKTVAAKYADAIESLKKHPRPLARVAAEFGFHPEVFRQYVHKYEPELAARGGMVRNASGRLTLRNSEEKYNKAVRLYTTTADSLKSIAGRLGLVYNSLGGYIRRSVPEAILLHQEVLKKQNE